MFALPPYRIGLQVVHWPGHKEVWKCNAAPKLPAPTSVVTVDLSLAAFHRVATALCIGASGPIAMLSWIWRLRDGYLGTKLTVDTPPSKGFSPFPPIILIKIVEGMEPPVNMRISQINLLDESDPSFSLGWLQTIYGCFGKHTILTILDSTASPNVLNE